jgi:hypothetical protein
MPQNTYKRLTVLSCSVKLRIAAFGLWRLDADGRIGVVFKSVSATDWGI